MSIRKQIIKNVSTNYATFFASMAILFFMSPFVIHRLGDTAYGIWVLISSLTGYLSLLDFGISGAVMKYVAEFNAKDNKEKLNKIVSASFLMFLIIGIVTFLITVFISLWVDNIFNLPGEYQGIAPILVMIIGSNIAIGFPMGVFGGIIRGHQRFDINSLYYFSILVVKSILTVIFIGIGYGILALAIITVVTSFAGYVAQMIIAYKVNPNIKIRLNNLDKGTFKLIFQFSFYMFILSIAATLIFSSNPVIIGYFMVASAITYYSIAAQLIEYTRQLISQMTAVLAPAVSHLDALGKNERIQEILIRGTRFSLMIALPIGIAFIVMGKPFITLWMGEKYNQSATILTILSISFFGLLSQNISYSILTGIGKLKAVAIQQILTATANIILSAVMVRRYGLAGVAIGMVIPMITAYIFWLPIYITRVVKIPYIKYFREAFRPPCVAAVPFTCLIIFFRIFLYPENYAVFFSEIASSTILFVICSFYLCFEMEKRKALLFKLVPLKEWIRKVCRMAIT